MRTASAAAPRFRSKRLGVLTLDRASASVYRYLQASPLIAVAIFSIPLLVLAALRARSAALWYDEIYTVRLCHLSSVRLWEALANGVDLQPPPFFLLTRAAAAIFGQGEIAWRAPSIVAFWVAALAVFRFVSRGTGSVAGLAAALFLMCGGAFSYASEARPYALVLASAGVALVCWQEAGFQRHRRLALIGLAFAMAVAVSSHYYAVLLLPPFLIAEGVRWIEKRRIDPWPAAATLLGGSIILFYLPFIRGGIRLQGGKPWNPPALSSIFEAYTLVLGDLAVPVALALAVLLLDVRRDRDDLQLQHPASEAALCAALLGIPVGGYILARFGSNMLAARYMLSVAIPFAVLFGWLFRQLAGRKALAALLALAVLGGWSLNRGLKEAAHPSGLYERPHAVVVPKDKAYQGLKIVFEDPVRYLQFFHYGTTEFQKNSTAIVDPPLAAKYTRIDAVDKNLVAAQPFFHFPAQDWKTFSRENRRFLLYWSPARFGWIRRNLEDEHARINLISIQGSYMLFFVTLPD